MYFYEYRKVHQVKVSDIPYGKFRDKSVPIDNLGNYDSAQEEIVYLSGRRIKRCELLFVTRQSMLKQVAGEEFLVSKRTTAATKLQEADEVVAVMGSI
ncbi:MAG: hypothetical protein ACLSXO_05720 [Coprococcus sp.]